MADSTAKPKTQQELVTEPYTAHTELQKLQDGIAAAQAEVHRLRGEVDTGKAECTNIAKQLTQAYPDTAGSHISIPGTEDSDNLPILKVDASGSYEIIQAKKL